MTYTLLQSIIILTEYHVHYIISYLRQLEQHVFPLFFLYTINILAFNVIVRALVYSLLDRHRVLSCWCLWLRNYYLAVTSVRANATRWSLTFC